MTVVELGPRRAERWSMDEAGGGGRGEGGRRVGAAANPSLGREGAREEQDRGDRSGRLFLCSFLSVEG